MGQIQASGDACRIVVGGGKGGLGRSVVGGMPAAAAVQDPRRRLARLMETRAAGIIREARLDALEVPQPARSRP